MVGPFGGRLFENFRPYIQIISASSRGGFCIFGTILSRFLANFPGGKGAPAESFCTRSTRRVPPPPGQEEEIASMP